MPGIQAVRIEIAGEIALKPTLFLASTLNLYVLPTIRGKLVVNYFKVIPPCKQTKVSVAQSNDIRQSMTGEPPSDMPSLQVNCITYLLVTAKLFVRATGMSGTITINAPLP